MRSSEVPDRAAQTETRSPVVFVFLDAWTLVTGRHTGMVEHILKEGFKLLDFEFRTLSEADAEEIYRTNHPIREGNSWHVARLVYPMGRSLGLLFGYSDPGACACARMQNLKGKANPALNQAGQLRHDFLAPNRCLSLMHSSDNLAQVRREGAVFFASDRIEHARAVASEDAAPSSRLLHELAGAAAEVGIERVDEPGLGTLFARVRLRLVQELQRLHPALPSWQTPLVAYRALWDPQSKDNSRGPVMREAMRYLELVSRERSLLEAIGAAVEWGGASRGGYARYYRPSAGDPVSILRCLQVLNDPEAYSQWDSNSQLPWGALFDRWERLLFRTHLFNFDDMLAHERPAVADDAR